MSPTNIIPFYISKCQCTWGGEYIDRIVALAYEQGFPLHGVDIFLTADGSPDPSDTHMRNMTQDDFDGWIDDIRDWYRYCDTEAHLRTMNQSPRKTRAEKMNQEVSKLINCYRDYTKRKSNHEPEIHRTMMCFMRLELEFVLKIKNYSDCQGWKCNRPECEALMKDIREEYPLSMFNEVLMEFFDTSMAHSEGDVKITGDLVKGKYEQIKHWHAQLGDRNLHK